MIGRPSQLKGRARLGTLLSESNRAGQEHEHERRRFQEMQGAASVVVAAPLLFPTPPQLAAKVARLAMQAIDPNGELRVLEPSAGTGNLLRALPEWHLLDVVAV